MAVRTPRAGMPHRPRLLAPVLVVLAVLLVLSAVAVSLYTDYLWFDSVDGTEVFSTVLRTKLLLFFLFGLLMAVAVGLNVYLAYRLRPPFRPMSLEQQNLERYRLAVEPFLTPLLVLISAVLGVFAGLSAAGRWQTWLLWRNRTDFGINDPEFGRDVSYYAMTYPMQRFALGFVLAALVLALIAAAATHYLFGGLRLQTAGEKVSPAARAHLSVLLGLIVLCKAVAYYLDRFGLVFSNRGFVQGAGYTDVNAVLPGKNILIGVAVICALLFFVNVRVRNVLLPGGALGLLVIAAVLLGGILPAFTQSARVKPNQLDRERDYIARNIEATRSAYGIANSEVTPYGQQPPPASAAVKVDTPPNARLLDPNQLDETFKQKQQQRQYFSVTDQLDIDRYTVGDSQEDFIVAAREVQLNGLPSERRNWVNDRLTYTHGNGLIAARADEVNSQGEPIFRTGNDVPALKAEQPRIYFGELSPSYSIVNTETREVDGPLGGVDAATPEGAAPTAGANDPTFSYDGTGGVELSGIARKVAFALKFREPNFLLSGALKGDSRVLYERAPRDRVKKVAPFLEVDSDPYPAVVDGQIVWIVDGYTTSNGYPYSTSVEFGDVTRDSQTGRPQPRKKVNYIRNSVKATVNAYTGDVTLYRFGEPDPVLESWNKAFGGDLMEPEDSMSADLKAHLRYPEDLFKVQRELLGQYHVTDPATFFQGDDAWGVPTDPANELNDSITTQAVATGGPTPTAAVSLNADGPAQPPYYSLLAFPGDTGAQFRLSTSFVNRQRPNLAAFASVSSDPDDYGKIEILQLPTGNAAPSGPGQVANQFLSNTDIANELFQFRRNGAEVNFGNLLTIPVAQGLLYVQPVFVQVSGQAGFPTLNQVLVAYGSSSASGASLGEALTRLLSVAAGTPAPDGGPGTPAPGPTPSATPSPTATGTPAPLPTDVAGLVRQASDAFTAGQAALQASPPNYAEYGRQQALLQAALTRLTQLQGAATPTPSPGPS